MSEPSQAGTTTTAAGFNAGTALGLLVEDLPDGVVLLDHEYRFQYANAAARAISRLVPEHFGGKTHWELFPETVGTRVEDAYRRVMRTRVAEDLEDFFYFPFEVWVRVKVLPCDGGIALYYRDVSEEHRLAAERQVSEDRLAFAMQAANGVGIWDWDVVNDKVYADARFATIFGVDPEFAAGGAPIANFTSSIHPDDASKTGELIAEALKSGKTFSADYRLVQKDGPVRWVSARGEILRNEAGEPVRFPGIVIDITQQKQTEAALLQSEKLAAVGRLASSIAHEINNPLEAVTNLIYLARQHAALPEVQSLLDLAEQELRRVSVIANQTLRFHKQSTRRMEITGQELFQNVLSLYEGRLHNAGIRLEKRMRTGRPVACFEGDIRQVLNNLVGNAIDSMPTGGRLLVRSQAGTDWRSGREGLKLTVADTGSGISPEDLKRIFEPFFTTKGINGNGLGLWISAEIVQRHEGRLRMRSRKGDERHGTVATLFLPFEAAGTTSPL